MSSRTAYPWFFFYRIARLTLIVFLPTLFLILFLYRSSYRTGIVSQLTVQMEQELVVLKHYLSNAGIDPVQWCQTLPPLKNDQYMLIKRNGSIVCHSMDKNMRGQQLNLKNPDQKQESISSRIPFSEDLFIQKMIPIESLKENMERFDRTLFQRIVPFALASYILYLFLFYQSTKPLGVILSKVDKFKDDIPFHKNLQLLYEKDEWGTIEEALNKADNRLQNQIKVIQIENEKNAAILESINDDIIAIDRFESILFFNNKFKDDFIKARDGQEITKKIWHIFDDEVLSAFRFVLQSGTPQSLRGRNFPGSHQPAKFYDLSITPLKSASGKIKGALGVLYDVTEFKLSEQMRVDFVANVSHEIRTPLTSIKGFTQILQNQSQLIDQSLQPFLEKIIANTERMISLFNDLLNLSVIESGHQLRSDDFLLPDLVGGVESSIIANYPEKKVSFEKDLRLEIFRGDFRLIEQVLLNLCDNACKYSGDSIRITISSFKEDSKAIIKIQDNGPGISKEHLTRIFERFYRIEASRESLRGTGLGLSIVKQIISKHHGRIWAESAGKDQGSTFIIELPEKT